MMRYPLLVSGLAGCLLACTSLSLNAQDVTAPTSGLTILQKNLDSLSQADGAINQQLEIARKLIDEELAAKRISESVAESLRLALRTSGAALPNDFSTVLANARVPSDNEKLVAAFQTFAKLWTTSQAQRTEALGGLVGDLKNQLFTLIREASKPADVDPLMAAAEKVQNSIQGRPITPVSSSMAASTLTPGYAMNFLRVLRRVLELKDQDDVPALNSALAQLQSYATNIPGSDAEVQRRFELIFATYQQAFENAQTALDQAFTSRQNAAAVRAALAQLNDAADHQRQVRASLNIRRSYIEVEGILRTYRNLFGFVDALATGDLQNTRLSLNNIKGSFESLGAKRAATFETLAKEWERDLQAAEQKAEEKRLTDLRVKLASVKTASELDALGLELLTPQKAGRSRGETNFPSSELGTHLRILANAWSSASPLLISQTAQESNSGRNVELAPEIAALRKRIERDVLAQAFEIPELNRPPLADLPVPTALAQLSGDLKKKGEWRRLLRITEGRDSLTQSRYGGGRMENELSTALRQFIAGQNFELAEQWDDAALAYKTVLRSTNENAPIEAAAERLKVLAKEHPKATPPAPQLER